MNNAIHVEPKTVGALIKATFPDYNGNKVRIMPVESITFTDLNWSGGTRNQYQACTITGESIDSRHNMNALAPWDNQFEGKSVSIHMDLAVVEHGYFCGKDMGLTIYVNPQNMTGLLPGKSELGTIEQLVLIYTICRKSFYNGQDRYDMAKSDYHYQSTEAGRILQGIDFPTREAWSTAKNSLITAGLLNKAGAVTTKGRNNRPL